MDWSTDVPAPASPLPCVSQVEHVSLPHVSVPQDRSNSSNMSETSGFKTGLLNYDNGQPSDASSWDGVFQVVSLFGTKETISNNAANIHTSLVRIGNYIKNHLINRESLGNDFIPVVRSLWELINTIFSAKWDILCFDSEKALTIRKCVTKDFVPLFKDIIKGSTKVPKEKTSLLAPTPTLTSNVLGASLPPTALVVPHSPNKNVDNVIKKASKPSNLKKSYAQTSKVNISSSIEGVL